MSKRKTADEQARDLAILKDRGERNRAAGLCRACGADAEGYAYCSEHRFSQRQRMREKRREAKARGLCVQCCARPASRGVRCEVCYERQRARQRARVEERVRAGVCTTCGHGSPPPGLRTCEDCRFADKVRKAIA